MVVIAVPDARNHCSICMLGETRISGRRRERGRDIDARLPRPRGDEACLAQLGAGRRRAFRARAHHQLSRPDVRKQRSHCR